MKALTIFLKEYDKANKKFAHARFYSCLQKKEKSNQRIPWWCIHMMMSAVMKYEEHFDPYEFDDIKEALLKSDQDEILKELNYLASQLIEITDYKITAK